jgi:hypothetical protein
METFVNIGDKNDLKAYYFGVRQTMRNLVPHYFVSTKPFGWKCSDCGMVFRADQPMTPLLEAAPSDAVLGIFDAHSCEEYRQQSEQVLDILLSRSKLA